MRYREKQLRHEIMLEGVVSILEGMNPRIVETKLLAFISEASRSVKPKAGKE